MKDSTKNWLITFTAGFLATVLGILLTLGVDGLTRNVKKRRTARLLAEQIVDKMGRTLEDLSTYGQLYNTVDSTSQILHSAILADTLDRVDPKVMELFLGSSIGGYVQLDVDSGVDAYKTAILENIGDIELLGHIDEFFCVARQYADISANVVEQKQVVADLLYGHFYGKEGLTLEGSVRYLHELPAFNIYYTRMQNARLNLKEAESLMRNELDACRRILGLQALSAQSETQP